MVVEYFQLNSFSCTSSLIRPMFACFRLFTCVHSDNNAVLKHEINKSVCVDGNIENIMTLPCTSGSGHALRVSHASVNPLQSLLQCI